MAGHTYRMDFGGPATVPQGVFAEIRALQNKAITILAAVVQKPSVAMAIILRRHSSPPTGGTSADTPPSPTGDGPALPANTGRMYSAAPTIPGGSVLATLGQWPLDTTDVLIEEFGIGVAEPVKITPGMSFTVATDTGGAVRGYIELMVE